MQARRLSVTFLFALITLVCVGIYGQNITGSTPGDSAVQANASAVEAQLTQARQLFSDSKILDAIKTYDAVIKLDPKQPEALTYRARTTGTFRPRRTKGRRTRLITGAPRSVRERGCGAQPSRCAGAPRPAW